MTNPTTPKKLIEIALSVKEISAESVRDKSFLQSFLLLAQG